MENRFGTFGDNDRAKGSLFTERISDVGNELILEHNDHIANTNIHVSAEKQAAWDNLKTFQTAGGTGTAITLAGVELIDGFQTTFVILASNSGAATTINTKPLYKPGTTTAPKLVAGKAATVWYNLAGDCFFIKASAEGTAVAGDVLAGKTFSNDDDTGLTGTLSCSGDAVAADVYIGKKFYNTDPKTQVVGSNPYKSGLNISPVIGSSFLDNSCLLTPTIPLQMTAVNFVNNWYKTLICPNHDLNKYIMFLNGQGDYAYRLRSDGVSDSVGAVLSGLNYSSFIKTFDIGNYCYVFNYGYFFKINVSDMSYTKTTTTVSTTYVQYDKDANLFYVQYSGGLSTYDLTLALVSNLYSNTDGTITGFAIDGTYYYISTTSGTTYKIKKFRKSDNSLVFSTTIASAVMIRSVLSDGTIIGQISSTVYRLNKIDGSIINSIVQPFAGYVQDLVVVNDFIYSSNGSLALYLPDLTQSKIVGGLLGTSYQLDVINDFIYSSASVYMGASQYQSMLHMFPANLTLK